MNNAKVKALNVFEKHYISVHEINLHHTLSENVEVRLENTFNCSSCGIKYIAYWLQMALDVRSLLLSKNEEKLMNSHKTFRTFSREFVLK